jgi:hypothetical protein
MQGVALPGLRHARRCTTWVAPCNAFVASTCIKVLTSQRAIAKNVANPGQVVVNPGQVVVNPGQVGARWYNLWCCQQGVVTCDVNNAVLDSDE